MKELLRQYAAYNLWANKKLMEAILELPEGLAEQEVKSSFPTLQKTILHMWDAETAWWQRVKLHERVIVPSQTFEAGIREVVNGLLHSSAQWNDWVNNASEAQIDHVIQYQNSKKEVFKQPVYEILMHVFNHNTYHRGQLVTMMRELGAEKIPGTDFVLWVRSKK